MMCPHELALKSTKNRSIASIQCKNNGKRKLSDFLSISVFLSIVFYSVAPTHGQAWHELAVEKNFVEGSQVGMYFEYDGQTLVMPARKDSDLGIDAGAVYIYSHNDHGTPSVLIDDTWDLQEKLYGSDTGPEDIFGADAAIEGDTLVVGARHNYLNSNGSAYVFERDGQGKWVEAQILTAPDGQTGQYGDWFAGPIALSSDILVIGAELDDEAGLAAGAAYVYRKVNGQWIFQQKLIGSSVVAWDNCATEVAIFGDSIFVGNSKFRSPDRTGSVFVFAEDPNTGVWIETQEIVASDGMPGNSFGESLAVQGDHLVVGARDDDDLSFSGAYIYGRDDGGTLGDRLDDTWIEIQILRPADLDQWDNFGDHVDFDFDLTLAVGDIDGDIDGSRPDNGSIHLFEHNDNGTPNNPLDDLWTGTVEISTGDLDLASDPNKTWFSSHLILHMGTLITGSHTSFNRGGAFHIFVETPEYLYASLDTPTTIQTPKGKQKTRTTSSTLFVDDNVSLVDVNVRLDMSHSSVGDLDVDLVHADVNGNELARVNLISRFGGSGDDFQQTRFDDEAYLSIYSQTPPFNGRFRPGEALSNFDDTTSAGFWTLEVVNYNKGNSGTLNTWSIDFVGAEIPPPTPSISVSNVSYNEGNSGINTPGEFTVTLSNFAGEDVMVQYDIMDGSATVADSDYNAPIASGWLVFDSANNQLTKAVDFTIIGDGDRESNETFTIELSNPDGASISKSKGTATIRNDDKGRRK